MDTFMCSSWYHLRYLSPEYNRGPFDQREYDYWMPVDLYTGGIEHATMHLIYTRFFHKALRDLGITEALEPMMMLRNQGMLLDEKGKKISKSKDKANNKHDITSVGEPMLQLRNQGMVLGEDGEKMSKSRGNVVAPDDLVSAYGADTVRAYLMFFARWELGGPWNSQGISGTERWLNRSWALVTEPPGGNKPSADVIREVKRELHTALDRISKDYELFEFNTIISSLMELLNVLYDAYRLGAANSKEWAEIINTYVLMMAPAAPHIAEELWTEVLGNPYSIHNQSWPKVDQELMKKDEITLVVQVNGKLRDKIVVPVDINKEDAEKTALASGGAAPYLEGKQIKKVIVIPGRLVNIVV